MDEEFNFDNTEANESGAIVTSGEVSFAPDRDIDFTDEDSVEAFLKKNNFSIGDFELERKKFKDLKDSEKERIKKTFNIENPDFEFIVIRDVGDPKSLNSKKLEAIKSELQRVYKVSTVEYKENTEGDSPTNFSIVFSANELKEEKIVRNQNSNLIESLNNFGYLASSLLIEPRIYAKDMAEAEKEIEEINKLFYNKYKIVPSFYSYLMGLLNNVEDADSAIFWNQAYAGASLAAGAAVTIFLVSNPIGWVIGGGLLLIGLFGAGPNITGLAETAGKDVVLNLKRIQYAGGVPVILQKDKDIFNQILAYNKPEKVDWLRFGQKIGAADKINEAIEVFVKDIYMQSKAFRIFQELANEITTGTTTSGLLKNTKLQDFDSTDKDKNKLSIFSSELAGSELNSFLNHILMFPAANARGFFDEEDATDIFEIKDGGNNSSYSLELNYRETDLFYKGGNGNKLVRDESYLFSAQVKNPGTTIQETYFDKNKDRLREYNRKMIGFLKSLFDSLVEDTAVLNFNSIYKVDKDLGRALGEKDIFALMEDNAYPDILMPKDPIISKVKDAGSRLSPDFYYFKQKISDLSSEEREKANRILSESKKFMENMRTGVTSKETEESVAYYDPNIFMNLNHYNGDAITKIKSSEVKNSDNQDGVAISGQISISSFKKLSENEIKTKVENIKTYYENEIEAKAAELNSFASPNIFGDKFGIVRNQKITPVTEPENDSYIHFNDDLGMLKAFPTFRLYLIEEDSIYSDRLLAFDDFFYYNSVISFNVHSSRELAASTATIQLQNISGLLDGTRKSVLRDIDLGESNLTQDQEDQVPTVESVVLRKGVNVQLRAGYANNTNDLDVLISGRVTEISYSGDNMMCNIVVQSYGVELEGFKYSQAGTGNTSNSFYSTHQLLGSLLLHPALKHFGRVKTGKLFQTFESKIPALDFEQYTENTGWSFNWTNSWLDWISDNSVMLTIGAVVTSFLTPSIRTLAAGLRSIPFVGKGVTLLSKLKINPTSAIGRGIGFTVTKISNFKTGINKLFGINKLSGDALKVITNLGKARNDSILIKFIQTNPSYLVGARSAAQRRVIEALEKAGFPAVSATAPQIRQALNTVIETELGFLARYFGWGASAELAALRLGTLPLARAGGGLLSGIGGTIKGALVGGLRVNTLLAGTGLGIAGAILGGEIIAGVIGFGFGLLKDLFGFFFNEKKRPNITKLLLSPQDDNIYCPDPSTYIKNTRNQTFSIAIFENFRKTFSKAIYTSYKYANEGIFMGIVGNTAFGWQGWDPSSIASDIEAKSKGIVDPRMDASRKENEYVLTSKTAWQVLHEMTLRHPGYIYGVRPYGNSLEYRVFFGQPGQRYFRKDISNFSIFRLNSIYEKISQLNGQQLSLQDINILFPEESQKWSSLLSQDLTDKDSLKQAYFTNFAINEWLRKTKDRFVPFRQYHSVNSGRNLVTNNIIVSGHNVYNAVSTHYNITDSNGESAEIKGTSVWRAASNSNIPQELLREQTIKDENIKGVAAAWRYSQGALIYGAKNMYEGSLLILGNSKIHPWDVVILNDNVNVMYGPVEVKSVTHMFSHETGFLTDVEVNALVSNVDDETTYTSLHQYVFFEARKKLYENFNSKVEFTNNGDAKTQIQDIVSEAVDKYFEEEEGVTDLPGLDPIGTFGVGQGREDKVEEVKKRLKEKFFQYYEKNSKFEPFFLNDIVSENALIPQELQEEIESLGFRVAGVGAGIAGLSYGAEFQLARSGIATRAFRFPGLLGAVAAGVGLYTATVGSESVRGLLSESLSSGILGKNMFRPTILSKVDNSGVIKVHPLVKDGKALLSGGFETAREEEKWSNVLGNIYNAVSGGYKGFIENKQLIEAYDGTAAYAGELPKWIEPAVEEINGSSIKITNYRPVKEIP